jgi:hypothetical protein
MKYNIQISRVAVFGHSGVETSERTVTAPDYTSSSEPQHEHATVCSPANLSLQTGEMGEEIVTLVRNVGRSGCFIVHHENILLQ